MSLQRLAAPIPAALATSRTSPLGTVLSATLEIASGLPYRYPSALAYRKVENFGLTSIIITPYLHHGHGDFPTEKKDSYNKN
jgi:hypothetical protein